MGHGMKLYCSQKLYSFSDAWVAWLKGEKFPIAFFGDSTVDGNTTTGWVRNELGVDGVSPNAFSKRLEDKLREAADNSVLRVYNAGFSGQKSDWGFANFDDVFMGASPYSDVKMIGIGFGINDRLGIADEKTYRDSFRNNINGIINRCFELSIQPFLITTQAIVEPGVNTVYSAASLYPMRTSQHVNTVANEVKREAAADYGLELIDINLYTEEFLLYSAYSLQNIIPDTLHFGDIGHEYEAGLLFSLINPQTIMTDGFCKIDYSNQRIIKSVPEDYLTMPAEVIDEFKVYVNRTKDDVHDMCIMSVYVFNKAKKQLNIKAYKSRGEDSDTYVKIDGDSRSLHYSETDLGTLELGLHKLEVFTGISHVVDFKGFLFM